MSSAATSPPPLLPGIISQLPAPSLPLARSLSTLSLDQLKNTSALELFQLQLSSDSLEATMDAMHRLSIVAQSLKDPCRDVWSVVIPYVATTLFSNSSTNSSSSSPPADELLLILGQQLSEILSILPILDFPMVVETLLPLLERLASMEETVVREQVVRVVEQLCATQSHSKAAGKQPQPPPVEEATLRSLVNLLKRLASADWFTAKMSVCGMMPPILELVVLAANNASSSSSPSSSSSSSSSLQQELLTLYLEACQDETPMVRRAAAKDMGKLIQVAGWSSHCESFVSVIVPLLLHDEQDSVRRLAVAALADVGPTIGKEHVAWTMQHWLPLVKDGSTDMSWRVRHNLAKNFSNVADNLGCQHDRRFMNEQALVMACFATLLTDVEAEVRAAAVTHLAQMLTWGGSQLFMTHLQPLLAALADDPVMEVRSKCASSLMDAAESGTLVDATFLPTLEPLLEAFLQDEYHEVQLQVLMNLHKIAHLLPGLANVVTSLLHMVKTTNWRVRQAVAKLLPHLAEARGMDVFQSIWLEPAWMTLLLDPVASVRSAVVQNLQLLVQVAGDEWIQTHLLPQHVRLYKTNSYLIRNTMIQAHVQVTLAAELNGPLWQEALGQILQALEHDKVPNVRMVAAKGLYQVLHAENGDTSLAYIQGHVRPLLERRANTEEEDYDCRQACVLALEAIQ